MSNPKDQVRIRRAPRVPVFLALGAALGVVATFVAVVLFPIDPSIGFGSTFGYFLLYGIPLGIVVGAVVAVVLDRWSQHRSALLTAEIQKVVGPDPEPASNPADDKLS